MDSESIILDALRNHLNDPTKAHLVLKHHTAIKVSGFILNTLPAIDKCISANQVAQGLTVSATHAMDRKSQYEQEFSSNEES